MPCRNEVKHVSIIKTRRKSKKRGISHGAWHDSDAGVYECGYPGGHQRRRGCLRPPGSPLPNRVEQYLPPPSPSWRQADPADGGTPQIHELGRAHPYRLRRLPGLFPGSPPADQGGGGLFLLPYRWTEDFYGTGGIHGDSVQSGKRRGYGLRRVCGEPGHL